MIISVKYNKKFGEFTIKRRNAVDGSLTISLSNRLRADEVEFIANAKHFYECDIFATWC